MTIHEKERKLWRGLIAYFMKRHFIKKIKNKRNSFNLIKMFKWYIYKRLINWFLFNVISLQDMCDYDSPQLPFLQYLWIAMPILVNDKNFIMKLSKYSLIENWSFLLSYIFKQCRGTSKFPLLNWIYEIKIVKKVFQHYFPWFYRYHMKIFLWKKNLSQFLGWGIIINYIDLIFVAIITKFWLLYPLTFFRVLLI